MGLCVYKVMSKTKKIGNKTVHVCKLAYKVSGNRELNSKWHFRSGCTKKTNIKSPYIMIESDNEISLYENTLSRSWFYDQDFCTDNMKFVERIMK